MHAKPKPPTSPARFIVTAAALILLLAQSPSARAHPGLDERIAQATAGITAQPDAPEPYLQRADLYRQHEQFDAALADLAAAEQLQPGSTAVMLARARVFNDAGQTTNALAAVQQFIAAETNNADAYILRARCQFKLNQVTAAVADYNLALEKISKPEPDLLLERARAQAAMGQFENAVKGLDEGMAKIGDVPALQLAAIEYERQCANFTAALARVDKIIASYPVKESWLVLRGEILAQAGRLAEAKVAFEQVLAGVASYPPTRRSLDLTTQLHNRARAGLARVETRLAQANHHVSAR